MKRFRMWKLGLAAALILILTACGGGGGGGGEGGGVGTNPDRDGDGVPNAGDAFPDDPTRFASFVTVSLANLTGGQFGTAVAINDAGRAVGFSGNNVDEVKAVFWDIDSVAGTAGVPTILNPLDDVYSSAYGINGGGAVVGESSDGGNIVPVLWPAGATAALRLSLGTFGAPAAAYGIDDAGLVVGEATDLSGDVRGVVWVGAGADPVSLGLLPGGSFSAAYTIGDNGLVVGEADNSAGETRAVAWLLSPLGAVAQGPVDLGTPGAAFNASTAFGVDGAGRIVGESDTVDGETHATLWTIDPATLDPQTVTALDLGAAGSDSGAYAVNDGGRVVGYDGRSGSLVPAILDIRNLGLMNALVDGGEVGTAFGMNGADVAVGLAGDRGFAAIPQ